MNYFNPSDLTYEFKDFIGIYSNAFTSEECDNIIKKFDFYEKKGFVYDRPTQRLFLDDKSLDVSSFSELTWDDDFIECFHQRFYDYIYPIYNNKYGILQQTQKHRSKYVKIQKTFPCQGYHLWHCETSSNINNRILSWILYLNDVEEGGETEFLYQSLRVSPKKGTFILFPSYFTHTHRGNPPLSGEKYVATGWLEYIFTDELQGSPIIEKPNNKNATKKINYI